MSSQRHSRRVVLLGGAGVAAAFAVGIPLVGFAQSAPEWRKYLPKWYAKLPPEKQTVEDQEAQRRATAAAAPPPPPNFVKVHNVPVTIPTPWSPFPHIAAGAGTIVEGGPVPFPSIVFMPSNKWFEERDGITTIVFAGADGQDAQQGLLIVDVHTADTILTVQEGTYRTPSKRGAVRITGATGERLTLAAADGTVLVFDLTTRTFASP